ncbi:hypothetical protein ACR820_04255 [Streptomyces netropsis]
MDAVLETYDSADFTLWPVADPSAGAALPLSGRLSPLEVGTAIAVWAGYNGAALAEEDARAPDGPELIRRTIAADCTLLPGGLRVRDTASGVSVSSGCCCGLENWREWLDLLHGDELWLGHDPSPRVEHAGPVVRLWPDGRDAPAPPAGRPVEVAKDGLPALLRSVQDDLTGFLAVVERWGERYAPALGAELAAKLDEDLSISEPLRPPPVPTDGGDRP